MFALGSSKAATIPTSPVPLPSSTIVLSFRYEGERVCLQARYLDRTFYQYNTQIQRGHTIPAGQAIPPHPGPASTFNLTSFSKHGISSTVSSATMVVGGRIGAKDSNVGRAAVEEVVETEDDLERAPADSLLTIDWLGDVCVASTGSCSERDR